MDTKTIPCQFVYANGRRCSGEICRARAYGPSRGADFIDRDEVRKFRLWCSEKDDHAGAISDSVSKQRMEFYPDEIPADIYEAVVAMCHEVGPAGPAQEPPAWDGRAPEQREAEYLNRRVMSRWPDEWEATRHLSEKAARKRRKALRARLITIDKKNAWNQRFDRPDPGVQPI